MIPLLRSELRKLRHTRSLLALPASGVIIAAAGAVVLLVVGKPADIGETLSGYGPLRFGPSNFGLLLVVFGIRIFADETQHHTLPGTLMRTPDRRRVLGAKALVATATTAGFCVVVYLVVIPITAVGLAARGLAMTYDVANTTALLGRVVVTMSLLAAMGVAVGAAVRNRTVALVAAVLWIALGEDLIGALLEVNRFLPGAAAQSLVSASAGGGTSAPAALLLLVTFAAMATAAASLSLRRDVG